MKNNGDVKLETATSNPVGLDGVEFIEYAAGETAYFEKLFKDYGFREFANLKEGRQRLFRQNDINFILNCEPGTFANQFSKMHGPCISATGWRVKDAEHAFETAVVRGAKPFVPEKNSITPFPAVYGIGDSLIYFIDKRNSDRLYRDIFKVNSESHYGCGLLQVDHFTNNVPKGEMQKWCDFYAKIFNFRETRYFDIRGEKTGLISKVMRSPCNKFAVPINEPSDTKSQIQEYLEEYKGSGIQHLALATADIVKSLEILKAQSLEFLDAPPRTYYTMLRDRLPGVTEDIDRLQKNAILVDGDDQGYLLQIFSKNIIGPIFFEIIQRKNHLGFGEGNFQALFDSIERDQMQRGYL